MKSTTWKTTTNHSNSTLECKRKQKIWRVLDHHRRGAAATDAVQGVLNAHKTLSTKDHFRHFSLISHTAMLKPALTNQSSRCLDFLLSKAAVKKIKSNWEFTPAALNNPKSDRLNFRRKSYLFLRCQRIRPTALGTFFLQVNLKLIHPFQQQTFPQTNIISPQLKIKYHSKTFNLTNAPHFLA